MARRGGNDSPFSTDGTGGINWSGNRNDPSGFKPNGSGSSPRDEWGQKDADGWDGINKRSNRNDHAEFEFKIGNEKTVLDKPVKASAARKGSGQAYFEGDDRWYTAGNGRKG
jgi:hypothetical protein